MHHPPHHCAHMHCLDSINIQKVLMNVSGFHLFHRGFQWHTFASSIFPCQTPFCQTAPLLPSVTQQQHVMEYWWEGSASTAVPPPSASVVVGQHNNIGGFTIRTALVKPSWKLLTEPVLSTGFWFEIWILMLQSFQSVLDRDVFGLALPYSMNRGILLQSSFCTRTCKYIYFLHLSWVET